MKATWRHRIAAALLAGLFALPAQAGDEPLPVLEPGRWPTLDFDLGLFGVGGGIGVPLSERVGIVVGSDFLQVLGFPIPWYHRPWPFPIFTFRAAVRLGLGRRSHLDVGPHLALGPEGSSIFLGDGFGLGGPFRTPGDVPYDSMDRETVQRAPEGPFQKVRWGGQVDLRLGRTRPLMGPRVTVDYVPYTPESVDTPTGRVVVVVVPLMLRWVE